MTSTSPRSNVGNFLTLVLLISVMLAALSSPGHLTPGYAQESNQATLSDTDLQNLMTEMSVWLLPSGKPNPGLVAAGFTPVDTNLSQFNWKDRPAVAAMAKRMLALKKLKDVANATTAKRLVAFRQSYATKRDTGPPVAPKGSSEKESRAPDLMPKETSLQTPMIPTTVAEQAVDQWTKAALGSMIVAVLLGLQCLFFWIKLGNERGVRSLLEQSVKQHNQLIAVQAGEITRLKMENETLATSNQTLGASLGQQTANAAEIARLQTQVDTLTRELESIRNDQAALLGGLKILVELYPHSASAANEVLQTLDVKVAGLADLFGRYMTQHMATHDQLDANLSELNVLLPIARQLAETSPEQADLLLAAAADDNRVRVATTFLEMLVSGRLTETQFQRLEGLDHVTFDCRDLPGYGNRPTGQTDLKLTTILQKLARASQQT